MDNIQIYHQSVFDTWPIENNSIQSIITSPPYWGLRKYDIPDIIIGGDKDCEHKFVEQSYIRGNDKTAGEKQKSNSGSIDRDIPIKNSFCIHCNAWKGQYGLEPSYKNYIEHTLLWAKEAFRVLKDDGVFFLNIGDSYQTQSGVNAGKNPEKYANLSMNAITNHIKQQDLPNKCRMLIPERIAIALIDEGWTLRNHIIWYKPNGMPESTKDRFSKKWESIFMFVKNEKYYFDLDAVKIESQTYKYDKRCSALKRARELGYTVKFDGLNIPKNAKLVDSKLIYNGKSEKTSTFIASQPYANPGDVWRINTQSSSEKHFAMWPDKLVERMLLCSTKEDDVILDSFCGSGTTLKDAVKNNRNALGIDLGYADIQERKLNNIQKNII